MFKNKIAVITGGAQGIGRCIADEFRKQGASVCIIDKQPMNISLEISAANRCSGISPEKSSPNTGASTI